jgi:hypothetical protein
MAEERWLPMSQAAEELGVPLSQISRLAKKGRIKSEEDAVNARVKLVEINEVRQVFSKSKYYTNKM